VGWFHPMLSLLKGNELLLANRDNTAGNVSAHFLSIPPGATPPHEGETSFCTRKKALTKFSHSPWAHTSPVYTVQDSCPLHPPFTALSHLQQLKKKQWVGSSIFLFPHKLTCPGFCIFPSLSSFYYVPLFPSSP